MAPAGVRPIKWRKFEKFLLDQGCIFDRQKGSHRVYKKPDLLRPIIVPAHPFDIPTRVIMNNLKTLGVDPADYVDYWTKNPAKKKRR